MLLALAICGVSGNDGLGTVVLDKSQSTCFVIHALCLVVISVLGI